MADYLRYYLARRIKLDSSKAILVSGCDSGLGNSLAVQLAETGAKVFAGCLTQEAVDSFNSLGSTNLGRTNLIAIQCDVSDASSVNAAFTKVEQDVGDAGLFALVCNAGIVRSTLFEWSEYTDIEHEMSVNFLGGVVRVVRTFLPLLKKAAVGASVPPRVICVSSISAYSPVLSFSGYSASKAAIGAWCRAIALEFAFFNIKVTCVYPGAHKSALTVTPWSRFQRAWEPLPPSVKEEYGHEFIDSLVSELRDPKRSEYLPHINTAASWISDLVTYRSPPEKSFVGFDCYLYWMIDWLPWSWQVAVSRWFALGSARPKFLIADGAKYDVDSKKVN